VTPAPGVDGCPEDRCCGEYLYNGLAFSPDNRFIAASVSADDEEVGDVVVWDVEAGNVTLRLNEWNKLATG
jgi:argininosuccinate synthase